MNGANFCKTMEMELTAWKAMLYDILRKMEKLPDKEKANILPNIQHMNILIEKMDNRIEEIRDKCTPETGIADLRVDRDKFNVDISSLRKNLEDVMQGLSGKSDK